MLILCSPDIFRRKFLSQQKLKHYIKPPSPKNKPAKMPNSTLFSQYETRCSEYSGLFLCSGVPLGSGVPYFTICHILRTLVSKSSTRATQLNMPNFFRESLAPLIYPNDLRTKLALIHWLQRKRLLKRNINCTGCAHRMNLNTCRRKPDGYQSQAKSQ